MKGLYLYCLRKKNSTTLSVVKTIDRGKVFIFPYKELEAVISEVDLNKFGSKEIQEKAQEDVNWIKEKAQIHEHVIERAMTGEEKIIPVIPMRFGTIFKTKKSLEEMLKKNYAKFRKLLRKLKGKQEWGVKVYLNEEVFEKHLRGAGVGKKKTEIASLPKGADFFVKKQIEEMVKREKIRKLEEFIDKIFTDLENLAVEANQGKNLDKALTGLEEEMILNANFLIEEENIDKFQKETDELKANYQKLGLIIQESGPWPPYNFVE